VAGFDAELYLRVTGEAWILDGGPRRRRAWDSPLLEHARALVAVGAISPSEARSVIDDYSLAEAVRSEDGHHLHHRMMVGGGARARRSPIAALKPRRVVPCDRTIEQSNGLLCVRHVILSEDSTSLAITWRPNPSGQSRSRRSGHMTMFGHGPGGPLQPQVADDRGTTVSTSFSGGGSDEEWEGHLTAIHPLAPDTAWIEVDGERLDLVGEAVACEVRIEPLPEQLPAHRYLWRRLAMPDFHGPPEIDGSIEALVAAGALDVDDPVLGDIRAVRDALPAHRGMHPGGGHARAGSLPEPWRSLLRRLGRQDGPQGALAVAAVTPEFDGFSVAVSSLESDLDGFRIEVDTAPGLSGGGPVQGLETRQLAWWAADERGHHHLGQLGRWSSSDRYSSGEINFWPALRSQACQLSIMPTGETSRAVITVPLTWAGAPGGGRGSE
jgi:hypothetical protein